MEGRHYNILAILVGPVEVDGRLNTLLELLEVVKLLTKVLYKVIV